MHPFIFRDAEDDLVFCSSSGDVRVLLAGGDVVVIDVANLSDMVKTGKPSR